MPTVLKKQLKVKLLMSSSVNDDVPDFGQILIFVNLPKTQKSKYLENETLFFFSNKKESFSINKVP